eukprot:m.90477 g.90477  ORF g.90477 m.90477 type:complete len:129 (-) comp15009_c0_seq5:242-628(-)
MLSPFIASYFHTAVASVFSFTAATSQSKRRSVTVSHEVTKDSPLYQRSWESLLGQKAAVQAVLEGVDPKSHEKVIATHTWEIGRILFDSSFVELETETESVVCYDVQRFHHVRARKPVNLGASTNTDR